MSKKKVEKPMNYKRMYNAELSRRLCVERESADRIRDLESEAVDLRKQLERAQKVAEELSDERHKASVKAAALQVEATERMTLIESVMRGIRTLACEKTDEWVIPADALTAEAFREAIGKVQSRMDDQGVKLHHLERMSDEVPDLKVTIRTLASMVK